MAHQRQPDVAVARRGLMLVLSSPSGAGKTTLSRRLLDGTRTYRCRCR
jgi:guanylate kinase